MQLKIYVMPVIELLIKKRARWNVTEDAYIWFAAHEPRALQLFS